MATVMELGSSHGLPRNCLYTSSIFQFFAMTRDHAFGCLDELLAVVPLEHPSYGGYGGMRLSQVEYKMRFLLFNSIQRSCEVSNSVDRCAFGIGKNTSYQYFMSKLLGLWDLSQGQLSRFIGMEVTEPNHSCSVLSQQLHDITELSPRSHKPPRHLQRRLPIIVCDSQIRTFPHQHIHDAHISHLYREMQGRRAT